MSSYENVTLIFTLVRRTFYITVFRINKTVDHKKSPDNSNVSKISTVAIIKKSWNGKVCFWFFENEKMCKNVVRKFPFVIKYVPHQYKTWEMCDKVLEIAMLKRCLSEKFENRSN